MEEQIKIVIVKHPNCGNHYTFKVQDDVKLEAGDFVICQTKSNPKAIGQCITPSFFISEELLQDFYNVTKSSLKPVVGWMKPILFSEATT